MKKVHNKLVRDYIPNIIKESGKTCKTRKMDSEEYNLELKKKLCEESKEVLAAHTKDDVIEEIADVFEIIDALKEVYEISDQEIKLIKKKKAEKNGKFEEKIFLEYVIEE